LEIRFRLVQPGDFEEFLEVVGGRVHRGDTENAD
jgi:hypothetical protein